jgi:hypothetical protein
MLRFERLGGGTAFFSGLLGIANFPFGASSDFAASDCSEFTGLIPWSDSFRDLAEPLLTFGSPGEVHAAYARVGFVVLLGFVAGLVALHRRQVPNAGTLAKWGSYVSVVGMATLAVSVFAQRWAGAGDWVFIALEVPALLLLVPGLPVLGFATLRANIVPRSGAWLLPLAVPGILLLTILTGHFSSGLLVLDLAWIILGHALWSHRGQVLATQQSVSS